MGRRATAGQPIRGRCAVETHGVDICVIEDHAAERKLLHRHLTKLKYTVAECANGSEGLQLVYRLRPRIVICDIALPGTDGLQLCKQIRADPSLDGTYVVLVTAYDEKGRRQTALEIGADDYLPKPYDLSELQARIRCGMRYHGLHERLREAALTDGLTGLWNHTQFRNLIEREFSRAQRYGGMLSVLMIDVDHFKSINDMHGHEAGNAVLRLTSRFLQSTIREVDVVARYGGEEFAVICPETGIADAAQLAERLRGALPETVRLTDLPDLRVHVSIGVASSADPRAASVNELIDLADQALYASKRGGRNRVTRADQMSGQPMPLFSPADELERLRKDVHTLALRTKEICLQSVWALIQALEARDGYSAWHSLNVRTYTQWLASACGWTETLRACAINAAMLHDLGKIGVPDDLLFKPQALNPNEAALMRQVPLLTCRILEPLRVFNTEVEMIRHLRERWDGTGYPDGLKREEIPIGSRLIAVAEAFDSLTCDRAFRSGLSIDEALGRLKAAVGIQFDPQFVQVLDDDVSRDRQRWVAQVEQARMNVHAPLPLSA